jgi:hypothetical protein
MLITTIIFTVLVALWGCSGEIAKMTSRVVRDLRSASRRSSSPPARRAQSSSRTRRVPSLPAGSA